MPSDNTMRKWKPGPPPPICPKCKEFFCNCEEGLKQRDRLVDSMRTHTPPPHVAKEGHRWLGAGGEGSSASEVDTRGYSAEEESEAAGNEPKKERIPKFTVKKSYIGPHPPASSLNDMIGALYTETESSLASSATVERMPPRAQERLHQSGTPTETVWVRPELQRQTPPSHGPSSSDSKSKAAPEPTTSEQTEELGSSGRKNRNK